MGVFSVTAPPPSDGDFILAPAGALPAVLVGLIDLGTQHEDYQGKSTEARKVFLVWELPGERIAEKNRNHTVGRAYTLSLHEKAGLRQLVERWRGQPFAEPQPQLDLTKLLRQPCLLSIVHKKSQDGTKTYAKVDTACQPPRGLVIPPATLPTVCWEIGCGRPVPTEEWLPRVFGETILEVVGKAAELKPPTNAAPATMGTASAPAPTGAAQQPAGYDPPPF